MTTQRLLIALVVLVIVGAGVVYFLNPATPAGGTACTTEAKQCPDGSYVGRTGPNCEFATCPSATSTGSTGSGDGGGSVQYDSGISGTVMLGPTCPVVRNPPDPQCADKRYSTLVAVFKASDKTHAIALIESGTDGTFQVPLPPGEYYVGAGESNLPRCAGQDVTVAPNSYTSIGVSCDTGIR